MADFYTAAYSKSEDSILEIYEYLKQSHPEEPYEVWMMELDRYGNHYVIICRRKRPGREPRLILLRRVR